MSVKDEFNDDEWFLLSATPAMIGAAMSSAAPSGVIGTIKELTASMRTLVRGLQDYPDSPLIQALLEKAENWDEAKERAHDYRERAQTRLKSAGVTSKEQLHEQVLADCREASRLVDERCSEADAAIYREWSVKIARQVAEASKEGSILGFGGERVSDEERDLMVRIQQSLGLPESASGLLPA